MKEARTREGAIAVEWPEGAEPLWQDPGIVGVGREAPRASFRGSPWISLSGPWRFHHAATPSERPDGFEAPDFDDSSWTTLDVPSHPELRGFGEPIYRNVHYPFDHLYDRLPLGEVPFEGNHVSSYRRRFEVPAGWAGHHIFCHFAGVDSAFYLWVNGTRVGYSEDSRTPAEFDLTPHLVEGENVLAVSVFRYSTGSWLEDQDMWNLSGIYRDVLLFVAPDTQIRDFEVRTHLDPGQRRASVEVDVDLRRLATGAASARLEIAFHRPDGGEVLVGGQEVRVAEGEESRVSFGFAVEEPDLWSAEEPHLHTLELRLLDGQGKQQECVEHRVGIRSVEILDGILRVNGARICVRGANRHEHDPDRGHCFDESRLRRDLELLKRNNFNAIRTAHYPNAPRFYELADEYGFYVVDEANIESHGAWFARGEDISTLPEWREAHFDRVRRMLERDKNHACIIGWSMGNEAGAGPVFDEISAWIHERDPSRVVFYEGASFGVTVGAGAHSDVDCPMYRTVAQLREWFEEPRTRPLILIEYAHAMGNSTGALDRYWDLFHSHPQAQGGFVWDWMDQGLRQPIPDDPDGRTYFAYGGDLGPADDGNFCMNGLVDADHRPHPGLAIFHHCMQPVAIEAVDVAGGRILLRNRYDFVDPARLLSGGWILTVDGESVASGTFSVPHLRPGETAEVDLSPPRIDRPPGSDARLRVSLGLAEPTRWAPAGHEVARGDFPIPGRPPIPVLPESGRVEVLEGAADIRLVAGDLHLTIDRETGALAEIVDEGRALLVAPLRPCFWRAPTDNDRGNGFPKRAGVWRDLGDALRTRRLEVEGDGSAGGGVLVRLRHPDVEASFQVRYRLSSTGACEVELAFDPGAQEMPELPRFGLRAGLHGTLDALSWYGPGPEPTYEDRCALPVGWWTSPVPAQPHPHARPQESAAHARVEFASLVDGVGAGLLVVGQPRVSIVASPFATEAIEAASHPHECRADGSTHLHIDAAQRGVGGDDSWGQPPLEEYRLRATPRSFRFWLRPLRAGDDPRILARTRPFPGREG